MKLISLLTIMLPVLLLMPSTYAKETRESSADPRLAYQSLRQEPRFQEPLQFDALDYPRLHTALFYATNAVRVRHGLAPLAYHPRLEQAAWHYAKRMVERDFMAHVDPYAAALRTPEQRLRAAGVVNAKPAENLATYFGIQYQEGKRVYRLAGGKGQFSHTPNGPPIPPHTYRSFAEAAIDSWMSSPGHRANILAETALELGCGAAFFWSANDVPKFKLVQLYQLYELAKP